MISHQPLPTFSGGRLVSHWHTRLPHQVQHGVHQLLTGLCLWILHMRSVGRKHAPGSCLEKNIKSLGPRHLPNMSDKVATCPTLTSTMSTSIISAFILVRGATNATAKADAADAAALENPSGTEPGARLTSVQNKKRRPRRKGVSAAGTNTVKPCHVSFKNFAEYQMPFPPFTANSGMNTSIANE